MRVVHSKQELAGWRAVQKGTVGFVPTMGALHAGHAALIDQSVAENEHTVVSIFVNPMQFGPREDLAKYPRPWEKDEALCRERGASLLYGPSPADIYPQGFCSKVHVDGVGEHWCGASRPGHFAGVATVVLKLLLRVEPDKLYLGQKDAQQAALLGKMLMDLDVKTRVVVCPTVREKDGLALSSRNQYLSTEERGIAPDLHRALEECAKVVEMGQTDASRVAEMFRGLLAQSGRWKIDYFGAADPVTMQPVAVIDRPVRLLAAAYLGSTRLIDNVAAGPGMKLS
jgi:pantoate--beta-alanine ligase